MASREPRTDARGGTRASGDGGGASTVVFLHIPKTAGMTVRQIIERNYPRRERFLLPLPPAAMEAGAAGAGRAGVTPSPRAGFERLARLPADRRRGLRMVYGHTVFGVHEALPGPATYVTMLREPIARVLSTYHYLRRRPEHPLHGRAMAMSLLDYARSDLVHDKDNLQTRILAGAFEDPGPCTDQTLERARRNLDEHFAAVGLTERFDQTVLLWGHVLGWRKLHYVSRNVTRSGPREAPPAEAVEAVRDANRLDLALYGHVAGRFDADLARLPDLDERLARFRRRNRVFRRVYPAGVKPLLRRVKRAVAR